MSAPELRRVLVLAHVFPRTLDDSMGAFLLHLADALAACGVSTEVIAPHAPGLADAETLSASRVHRFHYAPARGERLAYAGTMHEFVARSVVNQGLFALFNLAFLLKALRVARASRPHVLHAHWWLPDGLVGALASTLTGTPLVLTTHGTDVEMLRRTRWAMPLARFVFSRARAITCGSTYLRDQLLALGVADSARLSVVPMPVNPVFETAEIGDRGLGILTVARLTRQKGIDTLIDALAILRGRNCAAELTIIGDGPERAALREQARRLDLEDRVRFLGALPQQQLPQYYANAAVFVLPSIREGMGLVLAEALLCGAPVVAVNSGGVTDIVRDGETGLLVPERDATALAAALERLLGDRTLAAGLADAGRTWVRERYTGQSVAAQFARVYEDVARTNAKSPIPNPQSLTANLQSPNLRRVVGYVFAVGVLFYLGQMLWRTWGDLAATGFHFDFDLPPLVVSLGLLVVARSFAVEAWRRILLALGESLGFGHALRVWFLSNLTRYVPGNIWQVATMVVMVEQRGVGKANALLSQVIYTAMALAIATLLGLTFLLARPEVLGGWIPPEIVAAAPLLVAVALGALTVFFALPPTNRLIVRLTARLTRRELAAPTPTFARGLVPPLYSLAMWVTNGIAFYLFTGSIAEASTDQLPAYVAMNAAAYTIGYASFITPSGLGFREGALAWMLSSFFPTPVAVALSLLARLWSTAGELLGVLLVWSVPGLRSPAQGSAAR